MLGRAFQGMRAFAAHDVIRSIVAVGSAATISQLIQLGIAPVLSRLYSQADFGKFGAILGAANVAAALLAFGLSDAIIAARDRQTAQALAAAGCWIAVLAVPVIAGLSWLAIDFGLFGFGALPQWATVLIALETLLLTLALHLQMLLVSERRFNGIAQAYLAMGGARGVSQLTGGVAGAGFGGLLGGEIVGRAASAGFMMRSLGREGMAFVHATAGQMKNAVRRFAHFPLVRTPSALASSIGVGAPPIIVLAHFGSIDAGNFSLMTLAVSAPLALVQKGMGDVFLGHFKQRLAIDGASALRLLLSFAGALAVLASIGVAILLLWGPALFAVMFGEKWRAAGELARAAAPMIAAQVIVMPISTALLAANRPEAKIVYDILYLAALAIAYWVAGLSGTSVLQFVAVFSFLAMIATVCYFGLILWAVRYPRPTGGDEGLGRL